MPSEPIPLEADTVAVAELPGEELPYEEVQVRPWIFEPAGVWGFTVARYNRVDGLVPAWGFALVPVEPDRRPAFAARIGSATTHERVYWSGSVSQRLPLPGALVARFSVFQRAATFDDWKVWTRENDVASFLTASDLLDWWREHGFEAALDVESPRGGLAATVAYVDAHVHSQRNRDPFALFGSNWRDNPAVEEGTMRAIRLEGRLDTRDVQSPLLPSPGWIVSGTVEGAGGALGGDVGFSRASLDVRRYLRFRRDVWWNARLVWMGPLGEEDLPPQREAKLGGPGSLRGFRAASFVGDAALQAQTELRLPLPVTDDIAIVFLSWHWVAFAEAGAVARDGDWGDLHADVGVGISGINLFSYVGLFVAQRVTDLHGPEDGPRFVVRLRRDF